MDFLARWFGIAVFLIVAGCGQETPRPPPRYYGPPPNDDRAPYYPDPPSDNRGFRDDPR